MTDFNNNIPPRRPLRNGGSSIKRPSIQDNIEGYNDVPMPNERLNGGNLRNNRLSNNKFGNLQDTSGTQTQDINGGYNDRINQRRSLRGLNDNNIERQSGIGGDNRLSMNEKIEQPISGSRISRNNIRPINEGNQEQINNNGRITSIPRRNNRFGNNIDNSTLDQYNNNDIRFGKKQQNIIPGQQLTQEQLKQQELQKKEESFFHLGKIISFIFIYPILTKMYSIYELNKESFHNVFVGITKTTTIQFNDILISLNVLFLNLLILILLLPKTIKNNIKNHIFFYSHEIEKLIKNMFDVGITKFYDNRDNFVTIIFLGLINLFIVIFYLVSINIIFDINHQGIFRTGLFGILLFGSVVFYNNQWDNYIMKLVKECLVEERKDLFKTVFTLIFYAIGMILLLFSVQYIAEWIYNFFMAFDILRPMLKKL